MYALAIITYRVPLDVVEASTDAHRTYLRQLKADGTLVASGPLHPRTGGVFLLRVPDGSAASALDTL